MINLLLKKEVKKENWKGFLSQNYFYNMHKTVNEDRINGMWFICQFNEISL